MASSDKSCYQFFDSQISEFAVSSAVALADRFHERGGQSCFRWICCNREWLQPVSTRASRRMMLLLLVSTAKNIPWADDGLLTSPLTEFVVTVLLRSIVQTAGIVSFTFSFFRIFQTLIMLELKNGIFWIINYLLEQILDTSNPICESFAKRLWIYASKVLPYLDKFDKKRLHEFRCIRILLLRLSALFFLLPCQGWTGSW